MTRDEVERAVLQHLSDVAPDTDPTSVGPDEDLRDALDLDSMDMLRLVQALHRDLGVEVAEVDYRQLTTLRGAVDYLAGRLGAV